MTKKLTTIDLTEVGCKCNECPYQNLSIPVKTETGPVDVLFITNRPTANDLLHGNPLSGSRQRLLSKAFAQYNVDERFVYGITSLTLCSKTDDEQLSKDAARACSARVEREIRLRNPRVIITLGGEASSFITGQKGKISHYAGNVSTYMGKHTIPTFHPSAMLKPAGDRWYTRFDSALRKCFRILEGNWAPFKLDLDAEWCQTPEECHQALVEITNSVAQGEGRTRLAIDTETDGLRWSEGDLLSIGIYNGSKAYALDYSGRVRCPDSGPREEKWLAPVRLWPEETKDLLRALLKNERIDWVLHNESFDRKWLRHHLGAEPRHSIDTMCLALGTTEQGDCVGLDHLAQEYFDVPNYKGVLKPWLRNKRIPYSYVPRGVLARYLCMDVYFTYELVDVLTAQCEREGTLDLAYNFLMPAQALFSRTEYRGIKHNSSYAEELHRVWEPKVKALKQEFADYAKHFGFDARDVVKKPKSNDLNPDSPKQLMHFFFDMLKLLPPLSGRTTGKEFIAKYPDHEAVIKLERYRRMKKMLGTYVTGIEKHVWMDGKCHHNTLLFGTVTGRYVIKDPPLQVLPNEKKLKGDFDSLRKQFEPPDPVRQVWCSIDYSQIEVRVLWHITQDEELGKAIMSADFHKTTAAKLFKVKYEDVTPLQRSLAKSISFGIIYGITAKGIAQAQDVSVEYAQSMIDEFFNQYQGVREWFDDTVADALDKQWLQTETGRKRRWPLITGRNWREIRNQAVNFPIQSLASDINLKAMFKLEPVLVERGWGYPMFAVHDSIEFILEKEHLAESIPYIKGVMENPELDTCATFRVDVETGPNWGELTKYDLA